MPTVAQMIARVAGVVLIVLGALFWTGNALNLVEVHMAVGFVLVLMLWLLAFLAARAGASPALVALAVAWGVLTPVLGITQTQLLPGSSHWVIQVLHLVVGLVALALVDRLAATAKRYA